MYRPQTTKERMLHRTKIMLGHLKKVHDMVENDDYCINIIHQSQAIQSSLQRFDEMMIENHLVGCVSEAIKKGDDKHAINEVMSVFKKRNT